MSQKTKIFVDGNCIICDMEIAHYKKIAPELFEIVDISSVNFKATDFSLTAHAVNKNMHILTEAGEVKVGVEAFAHIWSRIEKYKWASNLIKKPVLNFLARLGYRGFTIVRPFLPKKSR